MIIYNKSKLTSINVSYNYYKSIIIINQFLFNICELFFFYIIVINL